MEIHSVSQLTRAIRSLLENRFDAVWVEGEVSNHRKQASGHQYFTLKDAQAQLSCVFFRGHAWNNRTPIRDGMKLRLFGDISLYEARGQYQLVVKEARAIGAGDLNERFEALKLKLRQEGLFDVDRKRPIPKFPHRLGIVTSPTGAVIRDLLSVLKRRAPWVEVLLFPVRVQGDGAYLEIMEALEHLGSRDDIDTIILARGGGSLEDLWSFNEEAVARAVAACPVPVVAAVGHETDFSIADFVADLRAPTPSAAAELTTPDQKELRQFLRERRRQLGQLVDRRLRYLGERLDWIRRGGAFQLPRRRLDEWTQRLDELAGDLEEAVRRGGRERRQHLIALERALGLLAPAKQLDRLEEQLADRRARLQQAAGRHLRTGEDRLASAERHLRALGPEQTLARGYSLLLDEKRHPVVSVDQLSPGQAVIARLQDGEASLTVDEERS